LPKSDEKVGPRPHRDFNTALRKLLAWTGHEQIGLARDMGVKFDKFRRDLADNKFDGGDLVRLITQLRSCNPGRGASPKLWVVVKSEEAGKVQSDDVHAWLKRCGFDLKSRTSRPSRADDKAAESLSETFQEMQRSFGKLRRSGGELQIAVERLYTSMRSGDALVLLLSDQSPAEWSGSGRMNLVDDIAQALKVGAIICYLFPGRAQLLDAVNTRAARATTPMEVIQAEFKSFCNLLKTSEGASLTKEELSRIVMIRVKNDESFLPFFAPGHKFGLFVHRAGTRKPWATGTYPVWGGDLVLPLSDTFADRLLSFAQMSIESARWQFDSGEPSLGTKTIDELKHILFGRWRSAS